MRVPTPIAAAIAGGLGLVLSLTAAMAQSGYPDRPVKLIVGFAPGGSTDIVARIVAQRLGERLGQTVIVENKAGAGGTIGADATAKAPPDGYTLTLGTTSTHAIAAGAYSKLPYDPVADFTQISLVAITPYLLVVNPQVKANNLAEFVALAKGQPGKLNYASAGSGTATHLAMEMLKDAAGLDLLHVPYKGSAPMITDLISGQVDFCIEPSSSILPQARAGKVRLLGVTTSKRQEAMPELPTIAEQGVADFEAMTWSGLLAPAGTQVAIVEQLNRAMNQVLEHPEVVARIRGNGSATVGGSRADFERFVRAEIARWGRAVRASGAQVD